MPAQLKSSSNGPTLILTLSNPEFRNALGPEIYAAGIEALNVAERSADVQSVIITGEGSHFCAGGNLNRLLANRELPQQHQHESIENLHSWIQAIQTFPKPVIAAVEGAAAGAGFSLALMCDFIVSASNAMFVLAYSNVGLSPDGGATWNLGRNLPRQLVNEWVMLGQPISADRLQALGVVNRITPPGDALNEALQLANLLNSRAGNVLSSAKELVNESVEHTLPQQLDAERKHFVQNLFHPNAAMAINAFLNKKSGTPK
jgi:enoyl-CoA hydratase/carnithine racemase